MTRILIYFLVIKLSALSQHGNAFQYRTDSSSRNRVNQIKSKEQGISSAQCSSSSPYISQLHGFLFSIRGGEQAAKSGSPKKANFWKRRKLAPDDGSVRRNVDDKAYCGEVVSKEDEIKTNGVTEISSTGTINNVNLKPSGATTDIKAKKIMPPGFPLINQDINNLNDSENGPSPILSIPFLVNAVKNHITKERLLTISQYGVGFWIVMVIWKEVREAWDEIVEEAEEKSRGGGVKEEHDMPFLSAESVDLLLFEENEKKKRESNDQHNPKEENPIGVSEQDILNSKKNMNDNTLSHGENPFQTSAGKPSVNEKAARKSVNKRIRRDVAYARELALRLHASGLPLENNQSTENVDDTPTVEKVLKSLTRTEGQLLANTLLSPSFFNQNEKVDQNQKQNHDMKITPWNEIGGLTHVKEALLDLMYPLLNNPNDPDSRSHQGNFYGGLLSHPPGLLLYGPPGCGKSLLARALAQSTNARFLSVTPSTLLRKYVGETNLNVRALFSLARKIKPCIIFVDEMDGLFRERGGGSGGEEHDVSRDLKTEFMSLWDGISTSCFTGHEIHPKSATETNGVIVIGATNRPFDVDSAFLRRMPRSFFVGLPDYASRCAILLTMLKDVPLDSGFEIDRIARESEGFSGSDLKELLRTAALFPLREARISYMQKKESGEEDGMLTLRSLTTEDVLRAKERVSPTQFSPGYRAALTEYASRANTGGGNHDYHYMDENSEYEFYLNQQQNDSQRTNQEGNGNLDSDLSETESSSTIDDDDDYF